MFTIVKRIESTPRDGVLLHVQWFDDDPSEDRDLPPALSTQVRIPVPDESYLTQDLIDEALERAAEEIETKQTAQVEPPAAVQKIVGQARAVGQTRAAIAKDQGHQQ